MESIKKRMATVRMLFKLASRKATQQSIEKHLESTVAYKKCSSLSVEDPTVSRQTQSTEGACCTTQVASAADVSKVEIFFFPIYLTATHYYIPIKILPKGDQMKFSFTTCFTQITRCCLLKGTQRSFTTPNTGVCF